MAGLATPFKNFRFLLEIDGVNMFQIQEVQAPTVEFPIVKHGAPGNIPDAKTPGKMTVGDLVVKKLAPAMQADNWAWDWFGKAIAGQAFGFSKTGFLKHLAPDCVTVIQNYYLGDIWVQKIEPGNLNSMGGTENYIQSVTFAVQFYFPKDSPEIVALLAGSAARAGGVAFLLGSNG